MMREDRTWGRCSKSWTVEKARNDYTIQQDVQMGRKTRADSSSAGGIGDKNKLIFSSHECPHELIGLFDQ